MAELEFKLARETLFTQQSHKKNWWQTNFTHLMQDLFGFKKKQFSFYEGLAPIGQSIKEDLILKFILTLEVLPILRMDLYFKNCLLQAQWSLSYMKSQYISYAPFVSFCRPKYLSQNCVVVKVSFFQTVLCCSSDLQCLQRLYCPWTFFSS